MKTQEESLMKKTIACFKLNLEGEILSNIDYLYSEINISNSSKIYENANFKNENEQIEGIMKFKK